MVPLLLLLELGAASSPPLPISAPSVVASVATGPNGPAPFALGAEDSSEFPPGKLWVASVLLLGGVAAADAISSRGLHERNPMLGRGQFGRRQVAIKIAITGGSIGAQAYGVRRWPWMRRAFTVANVATAGVAARNEGRR